MRYSVRLTAKAEADVDAALTWLRQQSAAAVVNRWFAQLSARIDTLHANPLRCGLAAESADLGLEIRELIFGRRLGRYRILFQVSGRTVNVLRVWHAARNAVSGSDL